MAAEFYRAMGRDGRAKFKQWAPKWVPRVTGGGRPPISISDFPAAEAQEARVDHLRRLAALARDAAEQIVGCLEVFQSLQQGLFAGIHEFLGLEPSALDEPAVGLVRACLAFFRDCDRELAGEAVRRANASCDQVLRDCERLKALLRGRDEAYRERRHYEEKVARLRKPSAMSFVAAGLPTAFAPGTEADGEDTLLEPGRPTKLARNQQKLARAREDAEEQQGACEVELRAFDDRRSAQSQAMLRALLGSYVRLIADWGRKAGAVAETLGDAAAKPGGGSGGQRGGGARQEERAAAAEVAAKADVAAQVSLTPSSGPCGVASEAEVSCSPGLDGPISEVLIAGVQAEILAASASTARVRLPAQLPAGLAAVEVRAAGWRQRLAATEAAFHYYTPAGFGVRGLNIALSATAGGAAPSGAPPPVASRTAGLLDGVVLTAAPLEAREPPASWVVDDRPATEAGEAAPRRRCYYFEVGILDLAKRCTGTTRTLSVGFAWRPPLQGGGGGSSSSSPEARGAKLSCPSGHTLRLCRAGGGLHCSTCRGGVAEGRPVFECRTCNHSLCQNCYQAVRDAAPAEPWQVSLPETVSQMPCAFVIGGDLPRAHVGGRELRKVTGWRPLLDLEVGAVVGVLLERVEAAEHRLSIFQNGAHRCSVDAALPPEWGDEVYGIVDVCGTVQRVELMQVASLPSSPPVEPDTGDERLAWATSRGALMDFFPTDSRGRGDGAVSAGQRREHSDPGTSGRQRRRGAALESL